MSCTERTVIGLQNAYAEVRVAADISLLDELEGNKEQGFGRFSEFIEVVIRKGLHPAYSSSIGIGIGIFAWDWRHASIASGVIWLFKSWSVTKASRVCKSPSTV